MNDPNGMVYYEGEYHLFYQYHPEGKQWGPMHWGHAVSKDMVHWEHLPIALYPDELGTMFSGSAVVDWHDTSGFFNGGSGLVALFTHSEVDGQMQSVAYSHDKGRTWQKYEGNPVITEFRNEDFRDPKVFWHEPTSRWMMVVAGGKVRFYASSNLTDWTFISDNDIYTECPDFFPLPVNGDPNNVRWVLNLGGREYCVGSFDGERFTPETDRLVMNYAPDCYAAQTFSDEPNGRRIMMNWMSHWDYANDLANTTDPWNGAMTIPYELFLREDDTGTYLVQVPIKELQSLRREGTTLHDRAVVPGENLAAGLEASVAEIVAEFELGTATQFGLKVRQGDNGQQTVIGYNVDTGHVYVNRDQSGQAVSGVFEAPLKPDNDRIQLHVFVDASSVEVFANGGRVVLTSLIFPDPESVGIEVFAEGGEAQLTSFNLYDLASIWR